MEIVGNIRVWRGVLQRMALRPPSTDPPALRRVTANPFHVLEVPTTASAAEIQRAARTLSVALANGRTGAQRYPTPLGPRQRDERLVQAAAEELLDPDRRILHELWADLPPDTRDGEKFGRCPEAIGAFGWRRA